MFVSQHTEIHLRGIAWLNYCVILVNGLAELCPDTYVITKMQRPYTVVM